MRRWRLRLAGRIACWCCSRQCRCWRTPTSPARRPPPTPLCKARLTKSGCGSPSRSSRITAASACATAAATPCKHRPARSIQPTRIRCSCSPARFANGLYTVAWRAVSTADGHSTEGSFAFGIGVAVANNPASAIDESVAPLGRSDPLAESAQPVAGGRQRRLLAVRVACQS